MRKATMALVCLSVLCSILAATPAAATKYVKWNAPGPANDGSSWSKAYLTIQEALDVAGDGEVVKVAGALDPGAVYSEKIIFKTGAILQGGYRGNTGGGPPDLVRDTATYLAIIDGGADTAGLCTVTSFANGSIDGFTVRGAETGIYCNTAFTISDNIVTSGKYGIYANGSSPTITNNTIDGHGTGIRGVWCDASGYCKNGYPYAYTTTPQISGNTVGGWTSCALYANGVYVGCTWDFVFGNCRPAVTNNTLFGGQNTVWVDNCGPTIADNTVIGLAGSVSAAYFNQGAPTFSRNKVLAGGKAGIYCYANAYCKNGYASPYYCTATVSGNTISGATEYGILCKADRVSCTWSSGDGNCIPTISNNNISGSGIQGIQCNRATPSITGNTIAGNADCGIYCYNDVSSASMMALTIDGNLISNQKKGVYCNGVSITVRNNTILGNSEQGVLCENGSSTAVIGNTFGGNKIGMTGRVSTPSVLSNLFAGNDIGINSQGGSPKFRNNTVANNGWYGIHVESGTPEAYNNIVTGSSVGCLVEDGSIALGYNNLWENGENYLGVAAAASDVSVDPQFLASAVGEYHLLPGSPCIGAGDNATAGLPQDADGKDRILPAEGVVDMGCFEWDETPYWVRGASQAKVIPAQYSIQMNSKAISAVWTDSLYLEDYDRKAGIRVEKAAHGLTATDLRASVVGTVQTNPDGERYVLASSVAAAAGHSVITPLGMNGRTLGGGSFLDSATGTGQQGIAGSSGLNNIGLLVRVWGRVVAIESVAIPGLPSWFTIDDGSGRQIKCVAEDGSPVISPTWQGRYAIVTGVSSCELDGGKLVSKIRMSKSGNPVLY